MNDAAAAAEGSPHYPRILSFTWHPDDKHVDEARLKVLERYKTSGLSGDEWRFNYAIELVYKGEVFAHCGVGGDPVYAAIELARAVSIGWGELEMDQRWEVKIPRNLGEVCCQPGCAEKATRFYRMREKYSRGCWFKAPNDGYSPDHRAFCSRHARRGDCGLDDADANYVDVTDGIAYLAEVIAQPGKVHTIETKSALMSFKARTDGRFDVVIKLLAGAPEGVDPMTSSVKKYHEAVLDAATILSTKKAEEPAT